MWYDINSALSHHCLFNFIVGGRGTGKTYSCKKWAIKDFLRNGNQFVYVRRFNTELKMTGNFFLDVSQEFPDTEFKADGRLLKINDKIAGYAIALSNAKVNKSISFPKVNKIIFDEFILDKGYHKYIPDEVTNFLELYETIARMRDVTAVFLANSVTFINPYFTYFDLEMPYGKNFYKKNDVLLQLVRDDEFIETKKNTRFGKLISGTSYGDYAIDNKFFRDSADFIKTRPTGSYPYINLLWKGETIGVWADPQIKLYCCEDYDAQSPTISLLKDDKTPTSTYIMTFRQSPYFKYIMNAFENNEMFFQNQKMKKTMYELLSTFIR